MSKLESLMFSIGVWGPQIIHEHLEFLRDLYRNERTTYMELQGCLEANGMSRDDVWKLANVDHPEACACWTCIGRLQLRIMRHRAEVAVRLRKETK
jgi:hypothetical protein